MTRLRSGACPRPSLEALLDVPGRRAAAWLRAFALAVALGSLLPALPALAGSHTWSGAVSGVWSVAGNWSAGGAPVNGETNVQLDFPNGMSNMAPMTNDLVGLNVTSIAFHDTAYAVTGNAVNLGGPVWIDGGVATASAYLAIDVTLTADSTFQVHGSPDLGITFAGVIGGPHGVEVQRIGGSGSPIATFAGANTYTGTTTVTSGYLQVDAASGLGSTSAGTVVSSGGTLRPYHVALAAEPLSVAGSGNSGNGALQLYGASVSGPIALTNHATFVTVETSVVSGLISGSWGVDYRVFDGQTLTLTADNTYFASSDLHFGTVAVNGNQPASGWFIHGSGGSPSTLGGIGRVGSVLPVAGTSAKRVDPGVPGNIGILHTSAFSLNDTPNGNHAVLHVYLEGTAPGTQHDQVSVTGTVDVTSATLEVDLGYVPSLLDTFVIVANDGIDAVFGTFAGLPEGATFVSGGRTFQVSYVGGTGNDVTLTVTSLTPVTLQGFTAE